MDDYQGTGQVPIDVRETDVDFLVTGGLKWLIGGPGVAYLYVRKELARSLSREPRAGSHTSGNLTSTHTPWSYAETRGASRPDTPAVAAVYAGRAGLEIINKITPASHTPAHAALNQDLAATACEKAATACERRSDPGGRQASPSSRWMTRLA